MNDCADMAAKPVLLFPSRGRVYFPSLRLNQGFPL